MKVVKEGRQQVGWAKEFTCTGHGNRGGGCGAVLLVEFRDLFKTGRGYCDGSSDTYITFRCEQCGVLTDIEPKDYPPDLDKIPGKPNWSEREPPK